MGIPDNLPAGDERHLVPLGWDNTVREALRGATAHLPGGFGVGRVVRTSRRFTYVATANPDRGVVAAVAPRELDPPPVCGDWVALEEGDERRGWPVLAVAPRRTELARRDPAASHGRQVLAANVDLVVVVHPLDRPVRPGWLERSLILAHDSGAEPVVVLTKADLAGPDGPGAATREVAGVSGNARIIAVSVATGAGVGELADELAPNRTAVLVGASGAGKSTLVNELAGRRLQRTAEVRLGDAKGRHTTVTRDLIVLDRGGVVIDTPGVRSLGVVDDSGGVAAAFGDVGELAGGCRFRDCAHRGEPGCAVEAAVAAGDLDAERLRRYHEVVDEVADADAAATDAARRPRGRPAP